MDINKVAQLFIELDEVKSKLKTTYNTVEAVNLKSRVSTITEILLDELKAYISTPTNQFIKSFYA